VMSRADSTSRYAATRRNCACSRSAGARRSTPAADGGRIATRAARRHRRDRLRHLEDGSARVMGVP
jgi:hypothetical protein